MKFLSTDQLGTVFEKVFVQDPHRFGSKYTNMTTGKSG